MTQNPPAILNRHARAIRILTCLQSGPGYNAGELARFLGVSRRTIYRDLSLIREAGVRIRFDEREAAYRLERDTQQHLLPTFEPRDLMNLTLAAQGSLVAGVNPFQQDSRQAISKLLCLFPGKVRNRITRILGGCYFHAPEIQVDEQQWELAQLILNAIGDEVCLRATVDDERGLRRTKISPYRLDLSPTAFRLTGRSSFDACRLTFDLSDFSDVELTDIPFEKPRAARLLTPQEPLDDGSPLREVAEESDDLERADSTGPEAATAFPRVAELPKLLKVADASECG